MDNIGAALAVAVVVLGAAVTILTKRWTHKIKPVVTRVIKLEGDMTSIKTQTNCNTKDIAVLQQQNKGMEDQFEARFNDLKEFLSKQFEALKENLKNERRKR